MPPRVVGRCGVCVLSFGVTEQGILVKVSMYGKCQDKGIDVITLTSTVCDEPGEFFNHLSIYKK